MKAQLTVIPSISVHPQQVNFYYQYHWDPVRPSKEKTPGTGKYDFDKNGNIVETKKIKYQHLLNSGRTANGQVSKIAKKKIGKAVDYALAVASKKTVTNRITGRKLTFKVSFVTLTLPSVQVHPDRKIINKCLNQWLVEARKYYYVKNYVWRAEKQKNGNIHFHILIDKYIDYQELRDGWNRIVNKLGYVDRYREEQIKWHEKGFKVRTELLPTWSRKKQLSAYERGAKTHWNSPNSTDVHALRKIVNLKAYISKYMTKNEELPPDKSLEETGKIKQTGRIWGCNRELSNVKGARLEMDSKTEKELKLLDSNPAVRGIHDTYYSVYYIDYTKLPGLGCDYLFNQLAGYLYDHFGKPTQLEASG
jgi:uncharacterized membrane protein (UPF0136 family)